MADFRLFQSRFWSDQYVKGLNTEGKLLFTWLFTNSHVNPAGLIYVNGQVIANETGLPLETIDLGLTKFEKDGKIMRDAGVIWVVNFVKHQATLSPKLWTRIKKDLDLLGAASRIFGAYLNIYGESPALTQTLNRRINKPDRETETEKDIGTVSDTVPDTQSDTVSAAKAKEPTLPKTAPFKMREKIAYLRLERNDLERELAWLREKRDQPKREKDVEIAMKRNDQMIREIIEACQ